MYHLFYVSSGFGFKGVSQSIWGKRQSDCHYASYPKLNETYPQSPAASGKKTPGQFSEVQAFII
jgi:hypothetical protein